MPESTGWTRRRTLKCTASFVIGHRHAEGIDRRRFGVGNNSVRPLSTFGTLMASPSFRVPKKQVCRGRETRQNAPRRRSAQHASRISERPRAVGRPLARRFQKQNVLVQATKTSFAECVAFAEIPDHRREAVAVISTDHSASLALTFAIHAVIVRIVMPNDLHICVANLAFEGTMFTMSNDNMNRDVLASARNIEVQNRTLQEFGRSDQETGTNVKEYIYV
ncbi:hypothetical protein [Primorskyibacter flagellatus]|uniref:Uncharacterized protein n=1 Tax=Primorskyibacter flagellatus TaxID=1387277 RepID=A0A1W2BYY6_9RHOB|nr:hypothetical protein [Primorskyibacter flagellatus]SMC78207.1 hypothetical protein SAMN06295998_105137 [Primorskyibacter flagellatus]